MPNQKKIIMDVRPPSQGNAKGRKTGIIPTPQEIIRPSENRGDIRQIATPQTRMRPEILPKGTRSPLSIPRMPSVSFPTASIRRAAGISSKKRALYGSIFILIVASGLGYAFWSASLILSIEPKETNFDLGSGVRITVPAQELNSTLATRGEGVSKTDGTYNSRASGTLVVYNNFDSNPQPLVEKTRFKSPDGLIYRAKTAVTVPGKSGNTPGSAEVEVEADEPGPKYNKGLTDFSIPGFDGTPRAGKVYARSKTEIKGGATGTGKTVGRTEANELLDRLETDMLADLKKNFESSLPDNFLIFPAEFVYTTKSKITDPPEGSPAERFFGEVRGEGRTLGVDKNTYSDMLAKQLFKDQYEQGAYHLSSASQLSFKNINLDYNKKEVSFTVEGRAVYEWNVDIDALRTKILSVKNNTELKSLLDAEKGIQKVDVIFQPGFLKRIPHDPERLKTEISR